MKCRFWLTNTVLASISCTELKDTQLSQIEHKMVNFPKKKQFSLENANLKDVDFFVPKGDFTSRLPKMCRSNCIQLSATKLCFRTRIDIFRPL